MREDTRENTRLVRLDVATGASLEGRTMIEMFAISRDFSPVMPSTPTIWKESKTSTALEWRKSGRRKMRLGSPLGMFVGCGSIFHRILPPTVARDLTQERENIRRVTASLAEVEHP
jgi:hypothetical protein